MFVMTHYVCLQNGVRNITGQCWLPTRQLKVTSLILFSVLFIPEANYLFQSEQTRLGLFVWLFINVIFAGGSGVAMRFLPCLLLRPHPTLWRLWCIVWIDFLYNFCWFCSKLILPNSKQCYQIGICIDSISYLLCSFKYSNIFQIKSIISLSCIWCCCFLRGTELILLTIVCTWYAIRWNQFFICCLKKKMPSD